MKPGDKPNKRGKFNADPAAASTLAREIIAEELTIYAAEQCV